MAAACAADQRALVALSFPLTAARKHLTDAQLLAFLRTAAKEVHPKAPRMLCAELDDGGTLEVLFGEADTADLLEVILKVERKREGVFEITCGYQGDSVGDGGTWLVDYDATGGLLSVVAMSCWVC
jgi:hypothetical protein